MPVPVLRRCPGHAAAPAPHHPNRHGHHPLAPLSSTASGPSSEYAMSDTFAPRRARHLVTALALLLTAAGIVAVLVMAHGVPEVWWPQTGHAFTPTATPAAAVGDTAAASDPCDLIVGPAYDYCRRGTNSPAPSGGGITRTGALLLLPALLGIGVLLYRRRSRS
ncbi:MULTISPECIES: hypothetical protein [unclassified Streptomyces]|uniref:hypothetical protein n=1 Tax=unclassified Streptomyces TaxID=2593676 RepID=UPI002366F939|nr:MULTISPECIES: hypothetical protein [unclassified Streptomyces]MDF3141054.1 hypothetical protein [Streptomyces sp. T21Q-yed]WDF45039.1 hypothetical protein PBV52_50975 [Streptomyces sp. T12]